MTDDPIWRSLDELRGAAPPRKELPRSATTPPDPGFTRRAFLKVAGLVSLTGVAACVARKTGKIVPHVVRPPELTPGESLYYATALVLDGYATGVLVESRDGRPIKVEGNPDHPASLGATSAHHQAAIWSLYDSARAQGVRGPHGAAASWDACVAALRPRDRSAGARTRLLLEPTTSPTVGALIDRLRDAYPGIGVHVHAALDGTAAIAAARAAFGRPLAVQRDLRRARRIVAIDSDFLSWGPAHLAHARRFADGRRLRGGGAAGLAGGAGARDGASAGAADMNRLYVIEPAPTPTGAVADHRLARRPSQCGDLLAATLAEVAIGLGRRPPGAPDALLALLQRARAAVPEADAAFVRALARDLVQHAGACAVFVGERQPAGVHALGLLLEAALGAPIVAIEHPVVAAGDPAASLESLVEAIDKDAVDALVILGGNPVYTAPADLRFDARVPRVPRTAYLACHEDATARACAWKIPAAHDLESWGDARAFDGTVTIRQPLIDPLMDGRTAAEVLAALLPEGERAAHDLVRERWRELDDAGWERALGRGLIEGSALPPVAATVDAQGLLPLVERWSATRRTASDGGVEVAFARDHAVHDGRFASNALLLELPDPITKLTWDNAALLSPRTAAGLGVETEDVVEIRRTNLSVRAPVLVVPGHADDAVTLPLGYGQAKRPVMGASIAIPFAVIERADDSIGFDAYRLRTTDARHFGAGASIARTGERWPLAVTQSHWALEGRDVVRQATLARFREDPAFARKAHPPASLQLYKAPPAPGEARESWAMTIDLTLCTGCNACVAACQAENNTPVVGKPDVLKSREMHWLRIDRYFTGGADDPRFVFQPMLCQHCEQAPCEYVCPVNATTHSPDGLNEMTYNRCIGTRFCSNNCPWKVRRFNWFDYQGGKPETLRLAFNPDVTVRDRGVMEKCTFCVQRIRRAGIDARRDGREIGPAAVETACQQACPARAIVFGSLTTEGSPVREPWRDPRAYEALGELGTHPRVRYLAKVVNPNEEPRPT